MFGEENEGSLVVARVFDNNVHDDDGGEEGDAENKPSVDVFEVGRAGKGRQGLGVEGEEGEEGGETHDAAVLEAVEPQEEGGVADEVEEDGGEVGGEKVVGRAAVEAEGESSRGASVLQTATEGGMHEEAGTPLTMLSCTMLLTYFLFGPLPNCPFSIISNALGRKKICVFSYHLMAYSWG